MLSTTSIVSPTLSLHAQRASSIFQNSVQRSLTRSASTSNDLGVRNADQLTYSRRLQSEAKQNMILGNNLQGTISQSQTQEAFLQLAIKKYDRMSVLAAESQNVFTSREERSNWRLKLDPPDF